MSDRFHRPGIVPAAVATLATLIALAVLVGAVVLLFTRCTGIPSYPAVSGPIQPSAPAQVTAIATSSAAVTATQSVRVTVRRSTSPQTMSRGPGLKPSSSAAGTESTSQRGPTPNDQDDEIVIELSQAVTASAASGAMASASTEPVRIAYRLPEHGRLGVALTTMPGVLALDYQLARVDVPHWLAGAPLEVGLDLVGNLEAGGVAASVGGKGYALVGGWSRWDGREQGIALGAGLRF